MLDDKTVAYPCLPQHEKMSYCTSYERIFCSLNKYIYIEATVVERLARSPPTKANRWESCRTMPLVGGFSLGSPVSLTPSFRRRSIFTSITLIGSEDFDTDILAHEGATVPVVARALVSHHSEAGSSPGVPLLDFRTW
ncbi:hypothetical protein PR048_032059 [Dryococelus australis]|uniref:Uncharacterized protein n=1 Tax=Dryococelus australis TaxID=614101 RepID=A0ABQ9G3Z9_9NEOP|nr:hypothetical protein PR048_032059 [Dryococelus australis]